MSNKKGSVLSMAKSIIVAFACGFMFYLSGALAQYLPVENSEKEYMDATFQWENSKPTVVNFDWVQLVSGEWLKGEIKSLFNDKLEFDSDKLDLLSLDWEDVKYVETHIPSSAKIEDYGTVYGFLEINEEKVIVTHRDNIQAFDRQQLVSFITGGEEESDYWSGKLTLGLNVRSGNTDQIDYNAKADVRRQTSFSRFLADYIGNISDSQDVQTINNHRVTASHDILKTLRFFYRPIFGEYYRDPFSNIDYRITLGTGIGYTIIDTNRTEWNVAGGPAYQATRFVSVQEGENIEETTPALVVSTDYEIELTKKLDFIFDYSTTWGNKAAGGYTHHMVTTFESEITGSLDFDVSFIWDHISNPTEADDGTVPLKDDYRLTVGIGFDY